jgi:hypothetical protein
MTGAVGARRHARSHLRGVADRDLGDLSDSQPHYLDVDRLYLVGDDLRWFRAVHRDLAREGDRLVDGAVILRNGGGCDQLHCHRPHAGNRTPPFYGLSLFSIFYGLDWIATAAPTVRLLSQAVGVERIGIWWLGSP